MIVRAAPPVLHGWLLERTGLVPTAGLRAIVAIDARGTIRGMVGFDGWTENAVQMHIALDAPAALRGLLAASAEYAFDQAGRGVVLGTIREGNARSLKLARRCGFREAYRVRDGWAAGEDLVVLEMRREDCRWLTAERKAA